MSAISDKPIFYKKKGLDALRSELEKYVWSKPGQNDLYPRYTYDFQDVLLPYGTTPQPKGENMETKEPTVYAKANFSMMDGGEIAFKNIEAGRSNGPFCCDSLFSFSLEEAIALRNSLTKVIIKTNKLMKKAKV